MWARFGSLVVAPWVLFAQSSWDLDTVPVITAARPSSEVTMEVRDRAELFGRGAERRAREALQRIRRNHRTPVHIETIESLDGAGIADAAQRRGRMAGAEQLYILVAGSERDVGVIAARHGPASRLSDRQREGIRRAFLGPLQADEADGALERGVRAIGTTLDSAARSGRGPNGWDTLISVATLVAALAVLLASRTWAWIGIGTGRCRRAAAGAAALGHVGGPPRVTASIAPRTL